jgi:signal transduction histidine kinase
LIARILGGKVVLVTSIRGVCKFSDFWLQGWPNNSWSRGLKIQYFFIARLTWTLFLMRRLIFSFLWDFSNYRAYLIFFLFQVQNHDSLLFINSMILPLSTILLDFIEDFSNNSLKYTWCNALTLEWHACWEVEKFASCK